MPDNPFQDLLPDRRARCRVIPINAVMAFKNQLINNWVIIKLVDGTLYSMYIRNIGEKKVAGELQLGVVPEYLFPGHTRPILANSRILFDYIDSFIITPSPAPRRGRSMYEGNEHFIGTQVNVNGKVITCCVDGIWR